MNTIYKESCWKYSVARHCRLARDWSNGPATACDLTFVSVENGAAVSVCVQITECQSGLSQMTVLQAGVIARTEDSTRYFVLRMPDANVGIGFRSREDANRFLQTAFSLLSSEKASLEETVAAFPVYSGAHMAAPELAGTDVPALAQSGFLGSSMSLSMSSGAFSDLLATVERVPGAAEDVGAGGHTPRTINVCHTLMESATLDAITEKMAAREEETEEVTAQRPHADEDVTMDVWRNHKKHIFALTNSGKPIYSRYGDEQNLAPFMASLMAMVSFVEDTKDRVRYFVAGNHRIVFYIAEPLYFVAVSCTGESVQDLTRQLMYHHNQVLSLLSQQAIIHIFRRRPDFDLRNMLAGSDRLMDSLQHEMNRNISLMMRAVQPLALPHSTRDTIEKVLLEAACPELAFALVIDGFNLIHMARPKGIDLDPIDIHLLMNFIHSSTTFHTQRTWTPFCLPIFNNTGMLHLLISNLTLTDDQEEQSNTYLVLIGTDQEHFYNLNECAGRIITRLRETKALAQVQEAILRPRFKAKSVQLGELLHFVYRNSQTKQIVYPALDFPYNTRAQQKRLFRCYQRVRQAALDGSRDKVFYEVSSSETVVGWYTDAFELYVALPPTVSKSQSVKVCSKLLRWIIPHESEYFIMRIPNY